MSIEKHIPIPARVGRGPSGNPISAKLRELIASDHGDSVLFADVKMKDIAARARALGNGWYTARSTEDGGVRVWKTGTPQPIFPSPRKAKTLAEAGVAEAEDAWDEAEPEHGKKKR